VVKNNMSKDQALGALILVICALLAIAFIGLLFFYDPYIKSFINIGAAADVRFWLIAAPVAAAFVAIMAIGAWIGYTMATSPSPKPIEEITTKIETENNPTAP
jgi:predicted DNA-binding transcriptional regulator